MPPITATFSADFSSFSNAVEKADVQLKGFEDDAGKVQKSLNAMGNAFSGQKVISEATLMAAAIDKIGGVTKLTEKELERAGQIATEAVAKMTALGKEAPASLQKIADAAANLHPPLTAAQKAAQVLSGAFGQFTAANLAAQAIGFATQKLGEFIDTGLKLPAIEGAFQRMTASIGANSNTMLETMTTATDGLVSDFDLMKSANKAMLLGLPVTTASMGELAKAATVLGKAMGQDATKSVDDLITALGRSSPQILDNLGLTVKVGEANDAYAAKLGKSAEQLTDAEEKTAFYEAAMEAARRKTEELGEHTKTLGEQLETAWVKTGNKVSGTVEIYNVGLGAAIANTKNFGKFLADWAQFGLGAAVQLAAIVEQTKELPSDFPFVGPKNQAATVAFTDQLKKANAELKGLSDATLTDIDAALALGKSETDIATALGISTAAVGAYKREKQDSLKASEEYMKGEQAVADLLTKVQTEAWRNATALQKDLTAQTKTQLAIRNAAVIDGLTAIQTLERDNHDYVLQTTLSETNYKIAKIHEWEAATLAAFTGTDQQLATYTELVRTRAQQQIDALTGVNAAYNDQAKTLDELARQATTSFAVIGGAVADADAKAQAFSGTMVLVTDNLATLNSQLSGFYDQLARSTFGVPGQNLGVPGRLGGLRAPGGGASMNVTNTFNIVDTESNIANKVSDNIMRSIKPGLKLGVN